MCGFCDVQVSSLTVFGLSKSMKVDGGPKTCLMRAPVRNGFLLKATLCFLLANARLCQVL